MREVSREDVLILTEQVRRLSQLQWWTAAWTFNAALWLGVCAFALADIAKALKEIAAK